MSNTLIIDTTKSKTCIILITTDKEYEIVLDEQLKVSESLVVNIEKLMNNAVISLSDVDNFAVVVGPGSFTGIRVGLATIKGFCMAFDKPCVAKNSFDVFADEIQNGVLVLKCTNLTSYFAKFVNGKVIEYGVVDNDKIKDTFSDIQLYSVEDYGEISTINLDDRYLNLLKKAFKRAIKDREFVDAKTVQPFYVQLSQAELAKLKKDSLNG